LIKNFDCQLLNDTIRKAKEKRWGLSVVYGLPVCETLQRTIRDIQSEVEKRLPEKYIWYMPQQLHITLIRGKSSKNSLSPMRKYLLETIICKINKCPEIILRLTNAQLYSDGYIRIPCQSINLFPLLSDKDLMEIENEIGLKWHRTFNSWISIGYIGNCYYDRFATEDIWRYTVSSLSQFMFYKPLEIVVENVKFIYFSNVTFMPIEEQHWIEIPLKSKSKSNMDISQLGISLY
jgi:hypothetical protein